MYYSNLGFRAPTITSAATPERITGAFMSRKDNPHDIVYIRGRGPALHHFAYAIMESSHIFRACDVAAELGLGQQVERGPQRHGLDHMLYVYFRDPDGYRAEIFVMPSSSSTSRRSLMNGAPSDARAALGPARATLVVLRDLSFRGRRTEPET